MIQAKGEEIMDVLSLRDCPEQMERFIARFQDKWATPDSAMVYRNCMEHCIGSPSPLPQWYLLTEGEQVLGGAGLIVNDFISRGDLWPWLCALYVEEPFRGQGLGGRLISHICGQALALGYHSIHLCTGHVGYYERYGFVHGGTGYHPWGESSLIYTRRL